ncbi:Transmembrane protein, partial [Globisporangium splendens]
MKQHAPTTFSDEDDAMRHFNQHHHFHVQEQTSADDDDGSGVAKINNTNPQKESARSSTNAQERQEDDQDATTAYCTTESPRDLLPRFRDSIGHGGRATRDSLKGLPQSDNNTGDTSTSTNLSSVRSGTNNLRRRSLHHVPSDDSVGGALRPGGPVNLFARENIGLLVNYYAVGIFNGILPGLVYPFFKIYLGLEGYQANATDTLLMFAWYFKFVFGIISDCMPVYGYRRKPYIIFGWCCVLVITTIMALNPAVAPLRYTGDGPIVNPDAPDESPKYVIPLMIVTIGYLFADVSCDGLMVEFAQREFEHMRGRAQLTVYGVRFMGELSGTLLVALGLNSPVYNGTFKFALTINGVFWIMAGVALVTVLCTIFNLRDEKVDKGHSLKLQLASFWKIMQRRATWQIVLYGFLQKLSLAFDVTPSSTINHLWLNMDPFTKNLFRSATTGIYAAGSFVTHKYLLNVSWRITMLIAIFCGLAIGLPSVMITVFDVYRNKYFYLTKDQFVSFFDCLAMMVRILVIVEIAEPGFESSTYGLVTTVYNLAGPMSTAISNYINSAFDVYDEDIKSDSNYVRWQVAFSFFVMYGVRVFLNLAVLPLLPKQKREAKALKLHGGSNKLVSAVLFTFFALVFVFAIAVNLMSLFKSTECLKIVGGSGCK